MSSLGDPDGERTTVLANHGGRGRRDFVTLDDLTVVPGRLQRAHGRQTIGGVAG